MMQQQIAPRHRAHHQGSTHIAMSVFKFTEWLCLLFLFSISVLVNGVAIPAVISVSVLLLLSIANYRGRIPAPVFFILIYFQIYAILSIFYLDYIDGKRLLGFYILQLSIVAGALANFRLPIDKAARFLLYVFVGLFYFQFISYYIFGIYIDFLAYVGLESRNLGGTFVIPIFGSALMRASGMFSEPGNYVTIVAILLLIVSEYEVKKSTSFWQNFFLYTIAPISLLLSFSIFGAAFFLILLFLRRISLYTWLAILILGAPFFLPYFINRFVDRVALGGSSGISFRLEYVNSALSQFGSLKGWLIGEGTLSVPGFFLTSGGADNDAGLLIFLLREFGVLFTLATCALIASKWFSHRKINWMIVVLFISKISPFMPVAGFIFGFAMFSKASLVNRRKP